MERKEKSNFKITKKGGPENIQILNDHFDTFESQNESSLKYEKLIKVTKAVLLSFLCLGSGLLMRTILANGSLGAAA